MPVGNRFVVTIFLGSFLLFLVQPMIARMVLPRLGGAPAVWNSAMLVYQALLLGGYAYAHWLGRFAPRTQAALHLAAFAIAALTLPIGLIAATPSAGANPFLWVPALLFASIGPLFFVVSAQAPLIQRWYALADGRDPYPLYAASNLGSFAGLLAYPLLVEPWLPLSLQRWLWTAGYGLLALFVAWCTFGLACDGVASVPRARPAPLQRAQIWRWIVLAAVPSGLILSTTLHLTTDIVAMPLMWVIPLGVYLLSFTIAFAANRGPAQFISRLAPFVLVASAFVLMPAQSGFAGIYAALAVINLFTICVALHSRLFDSRPDESQLTGFYLAMSFGGVLGGLFCALIAPQVFDWTYEHVILLVAAAYLLIAQPPFGPMALWTDPPRTRRLTLAGMLVIILLSITGVGPFALVGLSGIACIAIASVGNRALFAASIAGLMLVTGGWDRLRLSASPGLMTRSFFGIYAIGTDNGARRLVHGSTVHGIENLGSPARERMATAYYVPGSGVGQALGNAPAIVGSRARIDVVGLGAGTVACYARPGQRWTFFEIDPAIARIARNRSQFRFLDRCLPNPPIVIGDARLTLGSAAPGSADVLVVDAFSSDAIPMHLLTREAFDVYRRHLAPDALLMIHITNRYLDIEPVVAAAAEEGGWTARKRIFVPSAAERADGAARSVWVALSMSPATIAKLTEAEPRGWQPLRRRPGFGSWTDDNASLLPLIRS